MGSPAMKETTPTTSDPCAILRIPPRICLPARYPMPFSIRPHRRFPMQCAVTYNTERQWITETVLIGWAS